MELRKFVCDHARRTLYYPAGGEDWEPLCQLSHYCDVFVYCDTLLPFRNKAGEVVTRDSAWLDTQLKGIHKHTSVGDRLEFQEVKELKNLSSQKNAINPSDRWAKVATITLQEKGAIRPLKLVYIKGYGEYMYSALFHSKSIAPRILCIRHPQGVELKCRNGSLGQMVINGNSKPEFIVTHYPLIDCCDWGWNMVMQEKFDGWGRVSLLARSK